MKQWEHWGAKFDWTIVFGDPSTQDSENVWIPTGIGLEGHVLNCNVDDTRRWMVLKNQAIFRYALERDYTHVFRACDDSIVFPHRLLAHQIAFEHDYFGTMCGYGKIEGIDSAFVIRYLDYMHGGVGIGLSSKAMEMLLADKYPGPDASPYGKSGELDILPNHAIRGGWGTYWDDMWIGEVLKGHLSYSSPERNNTYYNYLVDVYDNPRLFASNLPIDFKRVIAHHSMGQMGTTNLTPGAFSTKYSKRAPELVIPYEMIDSKFNLHEPEGEKKCQ
jgi:hypothetical protein